VPAACEPLPAAGCLGGGYLAPSLCAAAVHVRGRHTCSWCFVLLHSGAWASALCQPPEWLQLTRESVLESPTSQLRSTALYTLCTSPPAHARAGCQAATARRPRAPALTLRPPARRPATASWRTRSGACGWARCCSATAAARPPAGGAAAAAARRPGWTRSRTGRACCRWASSSGSRLPGAGAGRACAPPACGVRASGLHVISAGQDRSGAAQCCRLRTGREGQACCLGRSAAGRAPRGSVERARQWQ